jgi:hypothetical protein
VPLPAILGVNARSLAMVGMQGTGFSRRSEANPGRS